MALAEKPESMPPASFAVSRAVMRQIELPRGAEAGVSARRFLEEHFSDHLANAALSKANLVVSELVNNAFVHGEGRIVLKTQLRDGTLRVEVIDEGSAQAPAIRERGLEETGGFGLRIVESLSRRWGAFEGTTHVWADLPTS